MHSFSFFKKIWLCFAFLLLCVSVVKAEEFTLLDNPPLNPLYTKLVIDDTPVYTFQHYNGHTVFRLYGEMNRKKGYYEAEVNEDNGLLKVFAIGSKPLKKETHRSAAVASAVDKKYFKTPQGWYFDYATQTFFYTDIFGKEYRFKMGAYQDGHLGYIPLAKNGRFIKGALAIDPQSVSMALKEKPYNFAVSKAYKNGYQKKVYITTSNGKYIVIDTPQPKLEIEQLKISPKVSDYSRAFVGQESAELLGIQKMLTELGYYAGDLDGVYGEGMAKALTLFQEDNGLKPTSKPDPATLRVLYFEHPAPNKNPVKSEDFEGNGIKGETYTEGYLDLLDD